MHHILGDGQLSQRLSPSSYIMRNEIWETQEVFYNLMSERTPVPKIVLNSNGGRFYVTCSDLKD